jgi:hypothetical protein
MRVSRQNLLEFLQFGLPYVFPQKPGAMVNGLATAPSQPVMRPHFKSGQLYVWPELHSRERGLSIEPFYPRQAEAAKADEKLYSLLALVDVLRVGRRREISASIEKLSKMILNELPR